MPHPLRRGSISLRLALVFALLMSSVLIGGAALVYVDVRAALDQSIDDRLRLRWEDLREHKEARTRPLEDQAQLLVSKTDGPAQAFAPEGTLLASTPSVADTHLAERADVRARAAKRGTLPHHDRGRVQYAVYGGTPYAGAPVVLVAADLRDRHEALEDLLHELVIGAALVVVLSTAVAYAISRGALAPVEQLRAQAEVLATSGDNRTLDVPPTQDEIARLATTLNELLEQLYATVQRERRFVADAGHELRTPLAIAQGELELLLDADGRSPEDIAALETALEELERLATLGQRLLDMGGITAATLQRDTVSVADLVARVVERQSRIDAARDGAITVGAAEDVVCDLDAHLVEVALTNLIENAFRHGAPPVSIDVSAAADDVRIVVRDSGVGFPPGFDTVAFDPFVRADQARTTRGAGIGLAIVRDVATAHGGSVTISGDDPSAVALVLPRHR